MGYSLRTGALRYTAWLPWNGTLLRAEFPAARVNGTNGFYDQLFNFSDTAETDFDALDRPDISAQQPAVADTLYSRLKAMIQRQYVV